MRVYAPRTPVRAGNTCIDSPFERELGGNSSRFKAYLRTQIFETVLFAGLWRGNGTRVERGEKKRKERLKGERKREGRRRRRKEGPVSVLFRVIATRTEASKGFVLRFHSWVALRGLLSFALFCASFFLIDGRVNRSCSPRKRVSPPVSAPPLPPWRDTRPI